MYVFKTRNSLQRGYGIGGLFRGLLRSATPLLKKGLLKAGKKALEIGANTLNDVQENDTSFKNAFSKQARTALGTSKPINRPGSKRKASSSKKRSKKKVARIEQVLIKQ